MHHEDYHDAPNPSINLEPRVQRTPTLRAAALAYARRGKPVFPLVPGGKTPLTEHGFKDATTDRARITAWWTRYPNANIGIPTGPDSGLLVIDVDRAKHGFGSLQDLTREHGELPPTAATTTGNDGQHIIFRYPTGEKIGNSAGRLGEGLDVRGEGGYIVAPPSRTTGPYQWAEHDPMGDAPAWLLERLREPYRAAGGDDKARRIAAVSVDGPPIVEGTRNHELTRIAGKLHDGTRGPEILELELHRINEGRCTPPLPSVEVRGIARSISRKAPHRGTGAPEPHVLELLEIVERRLWNREWRGMGELSARDVYVALIGTAREHGREIPAGVRVSISIRAVALAAGVSKTTALKAVDRLRAAGLVRGDNAERGSREAGAFVLLTPRANLYHSTTTELGKNHRVTCGQPLRGPRLRWSAPEIRRLGKSCGAVVDALEVAGGTATVEELADTLHKSRPRDLRRRIISRLEAASVVECSGNTVSLASDYLAAIEREREAAGEIDAERRDRDRYERERIAYANRGRNRPEPVPEMPPIREITGWVEAPAEPVEAVPHGTPSQRVLPTPAELMEFWSVPDKAKHYAAARERFAARQREWREREAELCTV